MRLITPSALALSKRVWVFSSSSHPSRAFRRAARIEPDRIFEEAVVAHQSQDPRFKVGDAVERVHEQTIGALIERERHGVGGEVAAAQVVENASRVIDRLTGLREFLAAGAADLDPHAARESANRVCDGVCSPQMTAPACLSFGLQFGDFALHRDVEVANRRAAGQVADGAAGQEDGHAGFACSFANRPARRSVERGKGDFREGKCSRACVRYRSSRRPIPPSGYYLKAYILKELGAHGR